MPVHTGIEMCIWRVSPNVAFFNFALIASLHLKRPFKAGHGRGAQTRLSCFQIEYSEFTGRVTPPSRRPGNVARKNLI